MKRTTKTKRDEKMDVLLDMLPNLLNNANEAAKAHTQAIKKWESKNDLQSDDE